MPEDNVRKIWSEAELDAALSDLHSDVGDDDELAFARASLLSAAGVEEAPPEPRRTGTWRWLAVAAAVVTLVGGLAIATSVLSPAPEPARPAATLPDLDRPLVPGEFRYAQKLGWVPQIMHGVPVRIQQKVELWIPADPTGVWHRRTAWTGAVDGLSPDGRKDVRINLNPQDEYAPGGVFPGTPGADWLRPDAAFVAGLIPDRTILVNRLTTENVERWKPDRHTATDSLTMVRSVLELGLAPKDLRFALRDALGDVPGVFTVPGTTPDGRPATVVGAKDSAQLLYLDPTTAQPLAWNAAGGPPMITRSNEVLPLTTTSMAPPTPRNSEAVPTTTTTGKPPPPVGFEEPAAVYTFAITRTSG